MLLVDEDNSPRDIALHEKDGGLKIVSELHRAYDSLQYSLIFISEENSYYLIVRHRISEMKAYHVCSYVCSSTHSD